MRQPYDLLLGQYKRHPLMGDYVKGNVPDFEGMYADPYWKSLSDAERFMWDIAMAFWSGAPEAKVRDLAKLDRENLQRFVQALLVAKWTQVDIVQGELDDAFDHATSITDKEMRLRQSRAKTREDAPVNPAIL